ncbi:cytochrome P450 [Cerioporus squamosus]|nr:cytochrome P450 [Cerioporus squamosus]
MAETTRSSWIKRPPWTIIRLLRNLRQPYCADRVSNGTVCQHILSVTWTDDRRVRSAADSLDEYYAPYAYCDRTEDNLAYDEQTARISYVLPEYPETQEGFREEILQAVAEGIAEKIYLYKPMELRQGMQYSPPSGMRMPAKSDWDRHGSRSSLDNLPGPPAGFWFLGNMKQFFSRNPWDFLLHGPIGSKWVQVCDPKAFHAMFIKEQDVYEEPVLPLEVLLGPGLLGTHGKQHRRQRKMLNPVFSTKHLREMMPIFYSVIHKVTSRRRIVEMIPSKSVQRLKNISDIMHERSVLIVEEKKAALEKGDAVLRHQVGEGREIMSILRLVLQLLAKHPDVQEKLREEVIAAAETESTDGAKLMDMPYMDAVCRETLRVSPGFTAVFRILMQDVIMPVMEPIRMRDGTLSNAVYIPKGTRVVANVPACNRDPALWGPGADDWRPSRWLEPLPRELEEAHIPGVYSQLFSCLGGGSRACIGFKLAQVEIKTVMFVLLQHFRFEPTGKPISWNFAAV